MSKEKEREGGDSVSCVSIVHSIETLKRIDTKVSTTILFSFALPIVCSKTPGDNLVQQHYQQATAHRLTLSFG